MKIVLLAVCLVALATTGFASAARAAGGKTDASFTGENGIFPRGKTNDGYARYFTGTSYLAMLSSEGVPIANVTFEPGSGGFLPSLFSLLGGTDASGQSPKTRLRRYKRYSRGLRPTPWV